MDLVFMKKMEWGEAPGCLGPIRATEMKLDADQWAWFLTAIYGKPNAIRRSGIAQFGQIHLDGEGPGLKWDWGKKAP
jgi:hypothetical protein